MRLSLILLLILMTYGLQAQYWFGPKVGGQRVDFIYQNKEYKQDSFSVTPNYGLHVGATMVYQASDRYSLQTEITYERLTKVVKNKLSDVPVFSKSHYNYLNIPLSLRWNFGSEPIHYYVAGGPKVSYWMGGKGILDLDEFQEGRGEPLEYRFVFSQKNSDGGQDARLAVPEANRFQFALTVGTGLFLDLTTGGRLSIDLRYSFGHSNVGFNNNPDFVNFTDYAENFRYRQNILSVSLAYLFEYDVKLQSKGMSTISDSNKKKKKRTPRKR